MEDIDRSVRLRIFEHIVETGQAPTVAETALALGQPPQAVEASYRRLAAGRAIVLAPGTTTIWMAHPFSAVPTPYPVKTARGAYWANCAWDALNISALLQADSETVTQCPDCGVTLTLAIEAGVVRPIEGVVHFAVPPRRFWDNIGFT